MSADNTPSSTARPAGSERRALAVVLAAGEGTRMLSTLPKILHPIAGRPIVSHVLDAVGRSGVDVVAVVVGPGREDVEAEVRRTAPAASLHVQRERLGTAHAVLAARTALEAGADDVIVLFGDTPLVQPETIARLRQVLATGAAVAVLGFEARDPTGYGRLLIDGDDLVAIREHRDASEAERAIGLCNGGIMALAGAQALALLDAVGNRNAKGEYYLTDVVANARAAGLAARVIVADEAEVLGINDRVQLAEAEAAIQHRLRLAALRAGVTLVAPETVFLSFDTVLGRDVVVEPHVVFGPGVVVEEGAVVRAFSHLTGAIVASGADVGPFARLRPGARIGAQAHVGNFVEIKNTTLETGVKVGHLTYLGDAEVGAGTNIGAGTITCNYDGFRKHRTTIGAGAFIGSNTSLVAPVNVGDGGYTGSGSVVTADVPADALALGRSRQTIKEGWAQRWRAANAARKSKA